MISLRYRHEPMAICKKHGRFSPPSFASAGSLNARQAVHIVSWPEKVGLITFLPFLIVKKLALGC